MKYLMWTRTSVISRFDQWLVSWSHLFDGIIGILSFGFLWPAFSEQHARRMIRKRVKRREEKDN